METLAGLALIALLVWLFLADNRKRGNRAVRAHIYLSALEAGKDRGEANAEAAAAAEPNRTQIHRTFERLQRDHKGNQRKLLKAAEAKGFVG